VVTLTETDSQVTAKSNSESSLSHAYYHACKTILVYYHFASGGAAPFTFEWLSERQEQAEMDQFQINYLLDIQEQIKSQGKSIVICEHDSR
jgi:hypothetical protein